MQHTLTLTREFVARLSMVSACQRGRVLTQSRASHQGQILLPRLSDFRFHRQLSVQIETVLGLLRFEQKPAQRDDNDMTHHNHNSPEGTNRGNPKFMYKTCLW